MKSLDEGTKAYSVYKWVKRDICIAFCASNRGPKQVRKKREEGCPLQCFFILSVKTKARPILIFKAPMILILFRDDIVGQFVHHFRTSLYRHLWFPDD